MTLHVSTSSSPTPLTLQAVAAIILVAVVVLLVAGMVYLLLAGSVAWALMLLQGLFWLAFQGVRRSWVALHRHVRRAASSPTRSAKKFGGTGSSPSGVLR